MYQMSVTVIDIVVQESIAWNQEQKIFKIPVYYEEINDWLKDSETYYLQ